MEIEDLIFKRMLIMIIVAGCYLCFGLIFLTYVAYEIGDKDV